jgi:RNA polymerase sigma factor (TIGR02999 family)
MNTINDITEFLNSDSNINQDKLDKMFELLYPEVKKIANMQLAKIIKTSEVTPTLLVNECYLKLNNSSNVNLQNRKHFYCLVSRCMRFHLIDLIRKQYKSIKQENSTQFSITQITADDSTGIDLLELNHALERLETMDKELSKIVELRFFGGFSLDEISVLLETNKAKTYRQWLLAKSILVNLIDDNNE